MRAQFLTQAGGVGLQRVFAHRVRAHEGCRQAATLRSDADHAALGVQQRWQQRARQAVRAEDVGIEEVVHIVVAPRRQQADATDTGVVHQTLQTLPCCDDGGSGLLHLRRVAHVQRQCLGTQVLQQAQVRRPPRASDHRSAGLEQSLHDRQPDATAGTGDEHRRVFHGRCRRATRASSGSGSKPTTIRQPGP